MAQAPTAHDPAAKWVRLGSVVLMGALAVLYYVFLLVSQMSLAHCIGGCETLLYSLTAVSLLCVLGSLVLWAWALVLPSRRASRTKRAHLTTIAACTMALASFLLFLSVR
ncbi:hypothetical protein GCM10010329_50620 [Streptomyces spiroverticillatus]|uniref:Transmembrane protein n=1 Tax=Streptomyces finlayi TaxID=67296 RepID=A0A918X1R2_9ACTN|nr:hypothetical protein [Streptomyces finlayi]GHA21049.1 hypothetical protein GCM10010329_50620 [Streptomyces spiroverticillatus]GHD03573.1 hypothetical protein GCM10010334_51570 [Streptomyces finlayi]